ncbi:hypothetical protein CKAH01_06766 [Colletotrichum kahawae]|uniref:Uncharacterized protein n=1 Tax=Colletotrichum kahawae TaxID=34407 RepID=A0AAD9Y6E4_COLKA|nr:hypothetical protein CKAH01_06766 [Colletotrichum kahawae]
MMMEGHGLETALAQTCPGAWDTPKATPSLSSDQIFAQGTLSQKRRSGSEVHR